MIKDFLIFTAFLKSKGIQPASVVYSYYADQWIPEAGDVKYLEDIASDDKTYVLVGVRFVKYMRYLIENETDEKRIEALKALNNELKKLAKIPGYNLFQVNKN